MVLIGSSVRERFAFGEVDVRALFLALSLLLALVGFCRGGRGIEEGILEGHLLFRMAKCNLQGPASALKTAGARRGNRGNAAKMHVKKFTPRLIAYIAFQTYFALSSLESWQEVHDRFDYKKFYWNIVGLFDGGNNAHILELFNFHVFGDKSSMVVSHDDNEPEDSSSEESDMLLLKAQRAAKRARLAADAAASA
ncbi:hypothetical protein B0H13DRAFT_2330507 [Mycena leptocephala]|nr:hypothetical protein B0H13DRAFT_2330507 [Mycena leptocephala]